MTLKCFFENYDLREMDILSLQETPRGISMVLDMDFEMSFEGGNHVRTRFDMTFCHEFLFLGVSLEKSYSGKIEVVEEDYKDGSLFLKLRDGVIVIPDCRIEVHRNVRPYVDHNIG